MNYLNWNNQIARHFFNPEKSGLRVWLSMGKDLVEKIAEENNSTYEDFIKAVNKGPAWVQDSTIKIHRKAFETFHSWRCRSELEYPPYIAYLALFVLPCNLKPEDSQSSSYYTRLNEIIGNEENPSHPYPDINKTLALWEDLERWSLEDKKSEFGEFQVDIYGGHFYVGIPQYQVVLTANDKTKLPRIFQKKGWDSDSNPTEAEIITVLKEFKRDFSSKTSKRIEEGKDDFLFRLTQRVFVELKEYDGETIDTEEGQKSNKHGFIDLCLDEIIRLNKKAIFSFRCRRKEGLPDENFKLKNNVSKWKVSTHNNSLISGKIENFDIDWEKKFSANFELSSFAEKYNFSYRGEKYKIFTSAEKFSISGWISGQRCTPEKQFYLAVHTSLSDKVHKWGKEECDRCQKLDFTGLPENWDLFEVKGVKGDSIKDTIPSLSIDEKPRIQFDGIRHSKGNKFFHFVRPTVSIIGGMKQISTLYCLVRNREAEPLTPSSEDKRVFSLPKTIPVGEHVKISNYIEISNKEDQIKANFIFVKSELKQFSNYSEGLKMNNFGILNSNRTTSGEPIVPAECSLQGAYGYGLKAIKNHPRLLPSFLLARTKKKRRKVYLVGNTPGEIITWPDDPFPVSWFPVWMIQQQSRRKFTIHSCWKKESSFLQNAQQVFTKDKIRLWKQVIWYNRKWIKVKKRQQRKWKLFLERVKNV